MTRKIALVLISDRRDLYLPRCLDSLEEFAPYPFCETILLADPEHNFTASGAVNAAWNRITDAEFAFHVEEDFIFTEPVDLEAMALVLDEHEDLAHLCLKRQPWNSNEAHYGGIIEQEPQAYTDRETLGYPWVEHRKFFSLNPSLVPRRVFELGFPEGSEPAHTWMLLDKGFHFGFWGKRDDPPRVEHIGHVRAPGSLH